MVALQPRSLTTRVWTVYYYELHSFLFIHYMLLLLLFSSELQFYRKSFTFRSHTQSINPSLFSNLVQLAFIGLCSKNIWSIPFGSQIWLSECHVNLYFVDETFSQQHAIPIIPIYTIHNVSNSGNPPPYCTCIYRIRKSFDIFKKLFYTFFWKVNNFSWWWDRLLSASLMPPARHHWRARRMRL